MKKGKLKRKLKRKLRKALARMIKGMEVLKTSLHEAEDARHPRADELWEAKERLERQVETINMLKSELDRAQAELWGAKLDATLSQRKTVPFNPNPSPKRPKP